MTAFYNCTVNLRSVKLLAAADSLRDLTFLWCCVRRGFVPLCVRTLAEKEAACSTFVLRRLCTNARLSKVS